MSELRCPFCGKFLDAVVKNQNDWIYSCGNPSCEFFDDCDNYEKKHYLATPEFWQELIRTRKALDVALAELQEIDGCCEDNKYADNVYVGLDGHDTCNIALDVKKTITQIKDLVEIKTALEQKD